MDNYLKEIVKDKIFEKVKPCNYAKDLKRRFSKNPELWYQVISPASKVEELIKSTQNDYSQIWDEHCINCFKPVNKDTEENFYVSGDKFSWICQECFEKLKEKYGWDVKED